MQAFNDFFVIIRCNFHCHFFSALHTTRRFDRETRMLLNAYKHVQFQIIIGESTAKRVVPAKRMPMCGAQCSHKFLSVLASLPAKQLRNDNNPSRDAQRMMAEILALKPGRRHSAETFPRF
uniref:Secreted protein n=1 Tax=Ascaris lumbricoides TaxID=6252 RepID=A0A0M3I4R0_ASCLU